MSYTKLFSHIITSSVWSEDDQTRILWITLLAIADKHGEVMASIPGLANVSNLSIESVKRGIHKLSSPDEYSRTPDEEGRRIMQIPGGWHVINYAKHRHMASVDEQRTKTAERVQRFRERQKRNASVTHVNGSVTHSNDVVTHQIDNADADAEADKRVSEEKKGTGRKGKLPPAARKGAASPDELFFSEISRHYPDLDIQRELRKMDAWFLTPAARKRKKTRRFIIAWLNKCDAPMKPETNGTSNSGQWGTGNDRVTPANI